MGRQAGLTEEKLRALPDFEGSPAFSELERLVLRYAVEMTRTPVAVPDDLFASLRRHFSDKQMVELSAVIAWENYRARFNHALEIEADDISEGAFCPLPERRPLDAPAGPG